MRILYVVIDDRKKTVGLDSKFAEFLGKIVVQIGIVECTHFVVDAELAVAKLMLKYILHQMVECCPLRVNHEP